MKEWFDLAYFIWSCLFYI